MPSRKDRSTKGKSNWLIWAILFLAFIVAACAGAYYASSSSLFDKPADKKQSTENRMVARDKTIVMIMGVDKREGDVGRSDTLMVATLDPKKNKVALLSVPRDTRVNIKKYGYDKINAAFAYGGYKLSQSTVENLLGVDIEHRIMVDIQSFKRVIDAIGGVDINVEKRMYYEDPWDDDGGLLIDLQPGEQHMDGDTAITYVRYRDEEGDIGRVARQQNFMKAVLDKITSPSIIPRLPAIIKEVFNCVETDMSLRQMLEFASSLVDARSNGLTTDVVPGKPMYIDGVSYWIPDLKKLRYTVADTLDVNLSTSDVNALEQETIEYERTIPSTATTISISEYNRYSSDDEDRSSAEIKKRKEAAETKNETTDDTRSDIADKDTANSDNTEKGVEVIRYKSQREEEAPANTSEPSAESTSTEAPPTPGASGGKTRN